MSENGIYALVALDVFNTYFDILCERIRDARSRRIQKVFVGDCMIYTTQLLMNNGWSPETDSPEALFDIVKNVLCMCFMNNGENGIAEWADDLNYIILN